MAETIDSVRESLEGSVVVDGAALWEKIEAYAEAVDELAVAGERFVYDVPRTREAVATLRGEIRAVLGLPPVP